ncbi:glycoside hydrolase family 13 protein [Niallia sp. Krafla_26]|uniref:glycoside hydrolase family 13 protein n=1 Tax=Niallia sp. Krafla_26 TaxID=3064703 RepID=UPI003D16B086
MRKTWWKEAVVYQVYPRSFMDCNGDGIGDIQGVITQLDYIQDLGIDVIWMSPIFDSPNDDNGYDIRDYKGIMKEFGTMSDFDQLLEEVHRRDMKLIMDLVLNHTSDEHPWFIESRSSKENPYRDYYIWRPSKNGKEPNNWESIFSGTVWEFDEKTNEYYMHLFSTKQPDLNWENPQVRHDLYDMVNWWLDKGIDGFRVDAISHIKKLPGLPDLPNPQQKRYVPSMDGHRNINGINTFLKELKEKTFANYDIMTVGEANGVGVEQAGEWVGEENGYFDMIFQFEHLDLWGKSITGGLDIHSLKKTLTKWQKGLEGVGWNALFLENHDQPRSVSTWGNDGEFREQSAKCLATLYFFMRGTPFIYQGQEIGMTNVRFQSIDDYKDVAIHNLYKTERAEGKIHEEIMKVIWKNGRDNARTPMQWSNTENAGFTTGTPWLKVNPNYDNINVEAAMKNPDSILHFYKKMILLRKENEALLYGRYDLILKNHNDVYAYTRTWGEETFVIVANLFAKETEYVLPRKFRGAQLCLSNYPVTIKDIKKLKLRPYEARVYRKGG